MNNQNFLRNATMGMALLIAIMLGWSSTQKVAPLAEKANTSRESNPTSIDPKPGENLTNSHMGELSRTSVPHDLVKKIARDASANSDDRALRIGVIGSTPARNNITVISELPVTNSKVRTQYRDAESRTCRMLVAGAPVAPPRSRTRPGTRGSLGRIVTFTIGLELDFKGRSKLPALVRGQVEKYFRKHRLSVQPVLYHDEQGSLYFGTDCQAAFFEIASPSVTVKSEPMIQDAIGRFRALGIVGGVDPQRMAKQDLLGRTLAMAFSFEKADRAVKSVGDRGRYVTELMLLHLPENATIDHPNVQVFVTSEGRMTLHRLDVSNEALNSPTPTISADVRFANTVMMGMYPAEPVVTAMRYRSNGVVSMEAIRQMSRPSRSASGNLSSSVLTITEILDQFAELSRDAPKRTSPMTLDGLPANSVNRFGSTDDRLDELLERRRSRQGSRTWVGRGLPKTEPDIDGEKPKLMTGLGK